MKYDISSNLPKGSALQNVNNIVITGWEGHEIYFMAIKIIIISFIEIKWSRRDSWVNNLITILSSWLN